MLVTGLLPLGQQSVNLPTILFGLGSGFGYALYSIFCKFALEKYSASTVTFYTFLFSAAFSLPLLQYASRCDAAKACRRIAARIQGIHQPIPFR